MGKYNSKVFLALLLVLVQLCAAVPVQAEMLPARNEIRVGLTSMYSNKETLTIKNTKLGYGYCLNNTYLQETVLESNSGFSFVPVSGYFVAEEKIYASYGAAKQVAEQYQAQGVDAYPGSAYQCTWRVYFGNASKYAAAEDLAELLKGISAKNSFEILNGNNYRVLVTGTFGTLLIDVDERYAYPQFRPVTVYEKNVACIDMDSRAYRGRMEIGRYGKSTLTAVNIVGLEEYLYGVVPAEMPSTWHEEALKAQAVCARSYALMKAGYGGASNAKKGYKVVDTVSSQVYKGYLAESVMANKAVDATKGEMICYDNKVITSYFFSTSGGSTESAKDVWAVDLPYLQSVPDFYEQDASRKVWEVTMSLEDISSSLAGQGITIGAVKDLDISRLSSTGRVYALKLAGAERSLTLQGTTIRTVLNLYSTKFKIVRQGDIPDEVAVLSADSMNTERISDMYIASADGVAKASESLSQYIVQSADNLVNYPRTVPDGKDEIMFAGMGYGHGVGMSQYGAKGMAEAGYTYKEIIEYYFTGAYVR